MSQTHKFISKYGEPFILTQFVPHRHYHVILDNISWKLQEFQCSWEMVNAVHTRWLVSEPIVHGLADPDLITAHQAAYNAGVLHCDISLGNIMIVDNDKETIKGGILINWDLCKVINPSGKSSRVHHYTRTVSKFMTPVYCMLPLTFPARGHGSSWWLISFSDQTLRTLSYTTSNPLSGFFSRLLLHICQTPGAIYIAPAFSGRQ